MTTYYENIFDGTDQASFSIPGYYNGNNTSIYFATPTPAIGNASGRFAAGLVSTDGSAPAVTGTTGRSYARGYYYIPSSQNVNRKVLLAYDQGGYPWGVFVLAYGQFGSGYTYPGYGNTLVTPSGQAWPYDQWVRLEIFNDTTGATYRAFKDGVNDGLNGTTPWVTWTDANSNSGTANGQLFLTVIGGAWNIDPGNVYVDAVKYTDSSAGWIGPYGSAGTYTVSSSTTVTPAITSRVTKVPDALSFNNYKFNNSASKEAGGTGAYDFDTSANIAYGTSNPAPKEGSAYWSLSGDGTNQQYLFDQVHSAATTGLSLDFYFATPLTHTSPLFTHYATGSSADSGWWIGTDGSIGYKYFTVATSETYSSWDATSGARAPASTITANTWYRCQILWTGGSAKETVRIYNSSDTLIYTLIPGTSVFPELFGGGVGYVYLGIVATSAPVGPTYIDDMYLGAGTEGWYDRAPAFTSHTASSSTTVTPSTSTTSVSDKTGGAYATISTSIASSVSRAQFVDSTTTSTPVIDITGTAQASTQKTVDGSLTISVSTDSSITPDRVVSSTIQQSTTVGVTGTISNITATGNVALSTSPVIQADTTQIYGVDYLFNGPCEGAPEDFPGEQWVYSVPNPGSISYSTTQKLVGSTSIKVADSGSGKGYLRANATQGGLPSNTYIRGYYYIDSAGFGGDSNNYAFIQANPLWGSAVLAGIAINKDGAWGWTSVAYSLVGGAIMDIAGTGTLPVDQWFRVETHYDSGGEYVYRFYYDDGAGRHINDPVDQYVKQISITGWQYGYVFAFTAIAPTLNMSGAGDLTTGTSTVYVDQFAVKGVENGWIGPYDAAFKTWTANAAATVTPTSWGTVDLGIQDLTPSPGSYYPAILSIPVTDKSYIINSNYTNDPGGVTKYELPLPSDQTIPHTISITFNMAAPSGFEISGHRWAPFSRVLDLNKPGFVGGFTSALRDPFRDGTFIMPAYLPGSNTTLNYAWDTDLKMWYTASTTGTAPYVRTWGPNEAIDKWGVPLFFAVEARQSAEWETIKQIHVDALHRMPSYVKKALYDARQYISIGSLRGGVFPSGLQTSMGSVYYLPWDSSFSSGLNGVASSPGIECCAWTYAHDGQFDARVMLHETGHQWDMFGLNYLGHPNGVNPSSQTVIPASFRYEQPIVDMGYSGFTGPGELIAENFAVHWSANSSVAPAGLHEYTYTPGTPIYYAKQIGMTDQYMYSDTAVTPIIISALATSMSIANTSPTAIVQTVSITSQAERIATTTSTGISPVVAATASIQRFSDVTPITPTVNINATASKLVTVSADTAVMPITTQSVVLEKIANCTTTSVAIGTSISGMGDHIATSTISAIPVVYAIGDVPGMVDIHADTVSISPSISSTVTLTRVVDSQISVTPVIQAISARDVDGAINTSILYNITIQGNKIDTAQPYGWGIRMKHLIQ